MITFQIFHLPTGNLQLYTVPDSKEVNPELWLTLDEMRVWIGKVNRRNRWGWLSARLAAKKGCIIWAEEVLNRQLLPSEIVIINEDSGRPYIRWTLPESPPQVSLSHHSGFGIAAITTPSTPVGCDIEKCLKLTSNVTQYFTTEKEFQSWLAACKGKLTQDEVYTLLWTIKESVLKCVTTLQPQPLYPFEINATHLHSSVTGNEGEFLFEYGTYVGDGAWVQRREFFVTGCVLNTQTLHTGGATIESGY